MSLLMEALRKAEAAKNKADGKEVDEKSQLSLEPKEAEETAPPVRESSRNRTTETTKNAAPESYEFKLEARPPADSGRKQTNTETSGPDAALTEDFSFSDDAFNNANTSSVKGILSVDVSQNETDPGNFLDQNDPAEDHIDLNLSGINAFDYTEAYDKDKEKTQNEILETLDKQAGADELYGYIPEESIQGDTAEVITDSAYEALEVAKELNEYERSRTQPGETRFKADQAVLDRQTASSLFRAKKNSRADRRNRVIVLGLLIALLPIGGGGITAAVSITIPCFRSMRNLLLHPQAFWVKYRRRPYLLKQKPRRPQTKTLPCLLSQKIGHSTLTPASPSMLNRN